MARKSTPSSTTIPIAIRDKAGLERRIIDLESELGFKDQEVMVLGETNQDLNNRLRREEEKATLYLEQVRSLQKAYSPITEKVDELTRGYDRISTEKEGIQGLLQEAREKDLTMRIDYEVLLNNANTKLSHEREEREEQEKATAELSQQVQAQSSELQEVLSRANRLIVGYTARVQELEDGLASHTKELSSCQQELSEMEAGTQRLKDFQIITYQEMEREFAGIREELEDKIRECTQYKKECAQSNEKFDEYVKWSTSRYTAIEEDLRNKEGENSQLGIRMGELLGKVRTAEQEKKAAQEELDKVIQIHREDTGKIREQHQKLVNFVRVNRDFWKLFPKEDRFFDLANRIYFSKELDITEITELFQTFLEGEKSKYHYAALGLAEKMFAQQHARTRVFYDVLDSVALLEMPVYQQLRLGLTALILTQDKEQITAEEAGRVNKILREISQEDPALELKYNNHVLQTAVYACSMMMEKNPHARLLVGSYLLREQSWKESVDQRLLEEARNYLSQSIKEDPSLEEALGAIITCYAGNAQFALLRASFPSFIEVLDQQTDIPSQSQDDASGEKTRGEWITKEPSDYGRELVSMKNLNERLTAELEGSNATHRDIYSAIVESTLAIFGDTTIRDNYTLLVKTRGILALALEKGDNPLNYDHAKESARQLYASGDYDLAEEVAIAITKADPQQKEMWKLIGDTVARSKTAAQQERQEWAQECYTKSLN